ncbi:vWA domain-containing protein [Streptomyces boninensis]|uniref:vWA domain-containing protein n=1 Tax=Streptomyces boninensis TaxID=2039455 RepID=UPI003B20F91E
MRRLILAVAAALAAILLAACTGGDDGGIAKDASGKGSGGAAPPPPAKGFEGGQPEQEGGAAQDQKGIAPTQKPDLLSTFGLDVDTASYSYARRTIDSGRLPAPDTVRHEEFVNSFRHNYPQPEGNGFNLATDGAQTGQDGWSLMRVGLATKDVEPTRRPPASLTFVVDVSGSMADPGRLDLVRDALHTAAGELRGDDSVAIVAFSDEARTVLPMARVGDGGRDRMRDAVKELQPTDSTNVEAGIRRGYDVAVDAAREGSTNRVVLLSDALANTGATDADTILDRIADARRAHGITLFGVGVGSDYGDAFMERLTNRGDGHTSYVSDRTAARRVFTEELPRHVELRARDAKAQVEFDGQTVADYRLIGYDNRQVADKDFRNDAVDGGEIGPGHTVTALYAVRLKEGAAGHVATATVRWLDPKTRAPHEKSSEIEAAALGGRLWGAAETSLQVDALAAYFADALRGRSTSSDGSDPSAVPESAGPRTRSDAEPGTVPDGGTPLPLPGAPTVDELVERSAALAGQTESRQVDELAETVRKAAEVAG